MCMYCERRKDVVGWHQPFLNDVKGNIVEELNIKGVIHDYQSKTPELILTSNKLFDNDIATAHIAINFCPICGRKLGYVNRLCYKILQEYPSL